MFGALKLRKVYELHIFELPNEYITLKVIVLRSLNISIFNTNLNKSNLRNQELMEAKCETFRILMEN